MSEWREDIERALADFLTVAELAGKPLAKDDVTVEFLPAPHRAPSCLPAGRMAIYGFWGDDGWLKIGKAGPNSNARYTTQHYGCNAGSTVAKSLAEDPRILALGDFDRFNPCLWMYASTHRVNILLPSTKGMDTLALLEAFLHLRLKPRYEGFKSQRANGDGGA